MRKRIKNAEEEGNESINVSPLIDVVFILLIFFIKYLEGNQIN